jgi:hypothetical protein
VGRDGTGSCGCFMAVESGDGVVKLDGEMMDLDGYVVA